MIPLYLVVSMSVNLLSQAKKYDEFVKTYEEISYVKTKEIENKAKEYNNKLAGDNLAVDPWGVEDYEVDYKISDNPDAVFAYVSVPSIDVSSPVYLGASRAHLISGFAHVDGTSLPLGGKGTRSVIAGHRSTVFGRLDLLYANRIKEGDVLRLDLGNDILEYKMVSSEIIHPSEWEKLQPIEGKDMVTLITCDPFPTFENRLLVNFERTGSYKVGDQEKTGDAEEDRTKTVSKEIKEQRQEFFKTERSDKGFKYIFFTLSILFTILLIYLIFRLIKLVKNK